MRAGSASGSGPASSQASSCSPYWIQRLAPAGDVQAASTSVAAASGTSR